MKTIYRLKSSIETTFNKVFTLFEDEETVMNTLINEIAERLTKVEFERRKTERLLKEREKLLQDLSKREQDLILIIKDQKDKDQTKALETLKFKKELEKRIFQLREEIKSLSQTITSIKTGHEKLNLALVELRRKKSEILTRQMSLGIIRENGSVEFSFDALDRIESRLATNEKLFNCEELVQEADGDSTLNLHEEELIAELKSY